MTKKWILLLCVLILLFLVGCSGERANLSFEETQTDTDITNAENENSAGVVEETERNQRETEEAEPRKLSPKIIGWMDLYNLKPLDYQRGKLGSLQEAQKNGQYDLFSFDLSEIDLSNFDHNNKHYKFDTITKWPEDLPVDFSPLNVLEEGKYPGLEIRLLHERGITGKGVSVAYIDSLLLIGHNEYTDQIVHYETLTDISGEVLYHGTPILSVLAGETVGVAPESGVYVFPYDPFDQENDYRVQIANGINCVLEINETLEDNKKIKVISISAGWQNDDSDAFRVIVDVIEKAKQMNVFVVTAKLDETHGLHFDTMYL